MTIILFLIVFILLRV